MMRPTELATLGLLIANAVDRRLLRSFLEQSGHAVILLPRLNNMDPDPSRLDLVITDDSWAARARETLFAWKEQARPLYLPVIVLLGPASASSTLLGAGFDDVLRQPVGKQELITRIHAFVRLRRASEQAEADHDARFRATLDRAPIGVAHCTPDGRFIRVNRRLCEILQLSEESLVRRGLRHIAAAGGTAAPRPWEGLPPEGELDLELRHVRTDGKEIWLRLTASLVAEPAERSRYLVAIVEDITQRKEAEASLKSLNAGLELRVAERTVALQAAVEELEAFSAGLSHDLRAPVRTIEAFTDLIIAERNLLSGDAGNLLLRVRAAATRMSKMIDGLLALSRASRLPVRRVRVSITDMARSVSEELQAQCPDRSVSVAVAEDMYCECDPVMCRQILENLLGNAWKYTSCNPHAAIEITMRDDGRGGHEFVVRDNGAGFDMAYADKLFKPFERLHSESEFPGVGMGLASVYRMVKRHGGHIRGESVAGQGSTFTFSLDARPPPEEAETGSTGAATAFSAPEAPQRDRRELRTPGVPGRCRA